jgi:hypothetical protein
MICQNCRLDVKDASKFCGNCGTRVMDSASSSVKLTSTRPNSNVRTLFVLGRNQSADSIAWLKQKYPSSKVELFTSIGAVRELAARMQRSGQIESICLIGTIATVPTDRLFDDGVSQRGAKNLTSHHFVESDFLYGTQAFTLDELPHPQDFDQSLLTRQLLQKIGIQHLSDMIAVGRIPFDQFSDWRLYLESLDKDLSEATVEWVALTANEEDWKWECEVIFSWLEVHASLYSVPPDDEYSDFLERVGLRGKTDATVKRILINGHGAEPDGSGQQSFHFYSDDPDTNSGFANDFSELTDCEGDALFLFACHGGDSGWWNDGLLGRFLGNGGRVAVAASSNVYCTQPSEQEDREVPPGALQVCAEFWTAADTGLPAGAALVYAKQKALLDALQRHPTFFARCLKEVLHFSLYGAPWTSLINKQDKIKLKPACEVVGTTVTKVSLLNQIRTGSFRSSMGSGQDKILPDIRQKLRTSLGADASFFSLEADQVLKSYQQNVAFNDLSRSLGDVGLDITQASFQSLRLGEKRFHLAEIPTVPGKRAGALVVMDDQGTLIQKYHLKESK